MKKVLSVLLFFLLLIPAAFSLGEKGFPELHGPYLGQEPPGKTPQKFAPGIISTDISTGCSGWGNDMEFFIFQRWIDGNSKLYIMNRTDNKWSKPEFLSSLDKYQPGDFTIAPDGKTLIFASRILIESIGSEGEGANIWIVEKTVKGWTEPRYLNPPVNTRYHDSYPSLAANKNLYFFSRKPGGYGQSDIYMSKYANGKYQEPVNLGADLNTEHHEWDTYIAPDESYMIFCSTKPEGLGKDDLYVTFRKSDGTWTKPHHMGDQINSEGSENRPYVTPDGKYLFYTSQWDNHRDIYWVSAEIIDDLRSITK
ncbi:MAG: PD40 domain-containing protein [Acidobacteria bacterium]|nr:PD40 domain-containing protein [Acidobacteriota bacterium]